MKIFGNSGSRATTYTARAFERKIILSKVAVVSWCRHTVASIHFPPRAPCRAFCRPKPRTHARTLSAAAALVWRNTRHSVSGLWRAGPTVFASSDARSPLPLTFITTVPPPPPPPPSPPSDGTSVLRGRRHYAPRPTTLRWRRRRRVSIAISESSLVERARAAAVVVISMPRLNAVAAHGQRRPPFSVPRLCTGRRRSVRAI